MTPDTRAIDRIAQVLASTGAPGTFATRRTASADELHLDVVGVGPIPLPMSPAIARPLCDIARPHNLLVYGPGQFFAAHQDSEKADGMIGTRSAIDEKAAPREFDTTDVQSGRRL